jgi:DNA polymerase-3 subunit delta
MRPAEFFKAIEKKGPSPAYFFPGQEIYVKTKAIDGIVKSIPEGQRDFNVDRFAGGETPLAEVLTVARTLPFIAPLRAVIFRDIEKARLAGSQADLLEGYLRDPSPSTVLAVTTEDTGAARTWSKKFPGLWTVVDFRHLKGAALTRAVGEAGKERGVRIGGEAVHRLIEATGSDLGRINQEMEKLAASVGKGNEVTVEQVHLLVCGYAYQTMFDMVQAMAGRDLHRSFRLVDHFFQTAAWQKEGPMLMGMLAKRFRLLRCLAGEAGPPPASFRVQKWQLEDLRRQAARFSPSELDACLHELVRIDYLVKSSPLSPRLLLEGFLLSLEEGVFARAQS